LSLLALAIREVISYSGMVDLFNNKQPSRAKSYLLFIVGQMDDVGK
jgi:hypothetical protein